MKPFFTNKANILKTETVSPSGILIVLPQTAHQEITNNQKLSRNLFEKV